MGAYLKLERSGLNSRLDSHWASTFLLREDFSWMLLLEHDNVVSSRKVRNVATTYRVFSESLYILFRIAAIIKYYTQCPNRTGCHLNN